MSVLVVNKDKLAVHHHSVHPFHTLRSELLGIDQRNKERHLDRDEFVAVLGLKPEEFEMLPKNEQEERKVGVGLRGLESSSA